MDTLHKTNGARLRELKMESERTWEDLAADADVSIPAMYNALKGGKCRFRTVQKIASCFGIKPEELIRPAKLGREAAFGERLRRARLAKGLTQGDLSELLQVSREVTSRYERGFYEPSLKTLRTISEKLEISLDWLIKGVE